MKKGGKTRFVVKGLNQERVINKLSQKVNIYNLKRSEYNICQFETDFYKSKTAKKFLQENGMEILSFHHFGLWAKIKRLATSYGLICALACSSIFYGLQYQFICKIEVYGEVQVEEGEIKNFLNSTLHSRAKSMINTKQLEMQVKENFSEISSISIAIVGQTLVVNLNEAVTPEEMVGDYKPIISNFDGIITKIQLIQGTMAINEGDIVKKGDILVYPYIIDSQDGQIDVAPKAEIYADIWLQERVVHYEYQIITKRTGEVLQKDVVLLNNLPIYQRGEENAFEEYEVEESIFDLSKNLILPLKLKRTIYHQTCTQEIIAPFEEKKDEIIAFAREKTLIFVQENEIIKEENYTIRQMGGCYEVCYIATVSRNIGG